MFHCFVSHQESVAIDDTTLQAFLIENAEDIDKLRLEVINNKATALISFSFEGSFDGENWHVIDNTTFATLAGGVRAQKFYENLHFPKLRAIATTAVDATTLTTNFLMVREDVI